MFDDETNEEPKERSQDPAARAKEKAEEIRMYSEIAAVFEGPRKFDAALRPTLDADLARDLQRTIGKLDKSKESGIPILPPASVAEAARVLSIPLEKELPTNDYHIHRRPGETMIARWLAGDEVGLFYDRFQAHVDAGLGGYRTEERQSHEWKQDPQTLAYLDALDAIELKVAERYLRDPIRQHKLFVLSTQTSDEINIAFIAEHVMGVPPADLVGRHSAPPEEGATERDLAWFYKLFSLRGIVDDVERMCFFTYLQKSDDLSF